MLKRSSIDKIMLCVVLSIFSKYNGPDDFSKALNNLFKSNNLPQLNLPNYNPPPPDMQTIASLFTSTAGMPPLTPSDDVSGPESGGDASPEVRGSVITHAVRSPCDGTSSASALSFIGTHTSPEASLACVGPAFPSSIKPNNELPHNGSASNSSPLAFVAGRDGSQTGSFLVTTDTISENPATTNVKIYKRASVRINSGTELLTAYENNNVVMLGSSKCSVVVSVFHMIRWQKYVVSLLP